MYRILLVLLVIAGISCKIGSEKNDTPENAIDPSIVNNPATASTSSDVKKLLPVFDFETEAHDFGTITEGEVVSYSFRFTNSGNDDLIIRSAQGSCGCTVPEFPKEAIKPGEKSFIKVTFNSEGRVGRQSKNVTIISNTIPNTKTIQITSEVIKNDNQ